MRHFAWPINLEAGSAGLRPLMAGRVRVKACAASLCCHSHGIQLGNRILRGHRFGRAIGTPRGFQFPVDVWLQALSISAAGHGLKPFNFIL
jgi:hypothetical protein